MKTKYLAVYDYGTGGVWAVIFAHSKDDVSAKYPILKMFDNPPNWMSEVEYDQILSTTSFDIDDEPPNWLRTAMEG